MTRCLIRRLSTTTTTTTIAPSFPSPIAAQTAAAQFLSLVHSLPPQNHTQSLDANQLHRLATTLNRPLPSYKTGMPIPPCHHLVYFTPSGLETTLGRDGTDTVYSPPAPFTRRMWAGGEVRWVGAAEGNILRVGDIVTEVTRVLGAEAKVTKAGEEMVVVRIEKSLENQQGVAVVDERFVLLIPSLPFAPLSSHQNKKNEMSLTNNPFLPGTGSSAPPSPLTTSTMPPPLPPSTIPFPTGPHTRDFTQTPISLFRFSALTFNAHRIHYDTVWSRDVEGHRERVVHGPLNLINMLDLWRDVTSSASAVEKQEESKGETLVMPKRVVYRATKSLYVGESYRILVGEEGVEKVREVRVVDSFGGVSMRGTVEAF